MPILVGLFTARGACHRTHFLPQCPTCEWSNVSSCDNNKVCVTGLRLPRNMCDILLLSTRQQLQDIRTWFMILDNPDVFYQAMDTMIQAGVANTGNSGIPALDKLIYTVISAVGAISGVGFLVRGGLAGIKGNKGGGGFGGGGGGGRGTQDFKDGVVMIVCGIAMIIIFGSLGFLINFGDGLVGSLIG